jgi:hypothetical protein
VEKVENYLNLNDEYLRGAQALVEKGDYLEASEKFWGAAAGIVKAIAAN